MRCETDFMGMYWRVPLGIVVAVLALAGAALPSFVTFTVFSYESQATDPCGSAASASALSSLVWQGRCWRSTLR
jgi:hypothetical protein